MHGQEQSCSLLATCSRRLAQEVEDVKSEAAASEINSAVFIVHNESIQSQIAAFEAQ